MEMEWEGRERREWNHSNASTAEQKTGWSEKQGIRGRQAE